MDNAMRAILEAAREYGMYEARPDYTEFDWTIADFPNRRTWYDVDLSGIVPEHAKAVVLHAFITSDHIGTNLFIRPKGYTAYEIRSCLSTQAAGIVMQGDIIASIGEQRMIQVHHAWFALTVLNLVVKGWWF